jgi:hypothetical protein
MPIKPRKVIHTSHKGPNYGSGPGTGFTLVKSIIEENKKKIKPRI